MKLRMYPHGLSLEGLTLKIKIRSTEELQLRRESAEQRHKIQKKKSIPPIKIHTVFCMGKIGEQASCKFRDSSRKALVEYQMHL